LIDFIRSRLHISEIRVGLAGRDPSMPGSTRCTWERRVSLSRLPGMLLGSVRTLGFLLTSFLSLGEGPV
jgi:hypothetical protein